MRILELTKNYAEKGEGYLGTDIVYRSYRIAK